MQTIAVKNGDLILLKNKIVTKEKASSIFRFHMISFALFSLYFAIKTGMSLTDSLGISAAYALLFIVSILSIWKTIVDKRDAFRSSIPADNLQVVRLKTPFLKNAFRPIILSQYPYAEFEGQDGTIKEFRVCLEKPALSKFKFDLVKKDVRIEESMLQKTIL